MLARFRTSTLVIAVGAAALVTPALSLAAPAQAAAGGHGGGGLASTHARALSVISTPGFAGYQAAVTAGSATSSAARYTVPTLSCTSAYRAITPVAGVAVNSFATYSSAFLFVGCHNGKAVYFPALVVNGTETNYTTTLLSAGDAIKVYTNVTSTGTTVRVTDVTKGITKKLTGPGASSSAAYAGDSDWFTSTGTLLGVPNFGKLTFTSYYIDGSALARWNPAQYQRVNSSRIVQIANEALTPAGTACPSRDELP